MPSLVRRRIGRLRWQALPEWEPLLFGPGGLRLAQWQGEGLAEVVKHGAHRTVYRVELSDRAFYVKHRRCARWSDALGHLIRRSEARREWQKLSELARRGVPSVRPVAWQERSRGGVVSDSLLVTEALPHAWPLDRYVRGQLPRLPDDDRRTVRRRLIRSLARFVASIHRAGVVHNDFHLGNVLVQWLGPAAQTGPGDGPLPLYLIDVPAVRFSSGLPWAASRLSLIALDAAWREETSAAERRCFWRTYLADRPELELPERRSALRQIELDSGKYFRRVARRRDRRALGTNRDYVALSTPEGRAHGVRDFPESELKRLAADPETLLWQNLGRPVKLGHSSLAVQAELPFESGTIRVLYKRYRPRNWWKALLGRFRRGRALRSWCGGQALWQRRIPTARPVAVCRPRGRRHRSMSYLATEWIDDAENLHRFGWRLADRPLAERLRDAARCAESLGALIGRMHACGIVHGDLNASNLLVVRREGDIATLVIDTDDVRVSGRVSRARRAAELARLATGMQAHRWVTAAVLCRFLRAYRRQFPPGQLAWKSLWREAARRSRRITRRKLRRGDRVL